MKRSVQRKCWVLCTQKLNMLITWICYSNVGSFFVCGAHWCSTSHLLRTTNKKHCHFSTNDFKWHVVAAWPAVLTIVLITWRHLQVYNGLIKHLQVGIGCLLKRDSEGKWRVKLTMVVTKNKHVNRRGLHPCLHQSLKLFLLYFSMKNSQNQRQYLFFNIKLPIVILHTWQYSVFKGEKVIFHWFSKVLNLTFMENILEINLASLFLLFGKRAKKWECTQRWMEKLYKLHTKIIQFSSALTATGKQPPHVLNLQ